MAEMYYYGVTTVLQEAALESDVYWIACVIRCNYSS